VTRVELVRACGKAIDANLKLALTIPRRVTGARRVFLVGRGTPMGEVACENCDGNTVAYFDPVDVLAWIAARFPDGHTTHIPVFDLMNEQDGEEY
jgi:hypothetical protein